MLGMPYTATRKRVPSYTVVIQIIGRSHTFTIANFVIRTPDLRFIRIAFDQRQIGLTKHRPRARLVIVSRSRAALIARDRRECKNRPSWENEVWRS